MSGKQTITALKWLRTQPDRIMVHLDGRPWGAVDLITAGRFKVGDRLDAETAAALQADQSRYETYQRALRLLGVRDHSRSELRQKLVRRGCDQTAIDDALNKLAAKNYLDDRRFAIDWVNHRRQTSPRSRRLLKQELKNKGVASDLIDEALRPVDEQAMALACLQRKRRRWQRFEGEPCRLKMLAHLANKGFSYGISRAAIESYEDQAD
jgi:regulatory protein